jgi:hypothetical protein
VKNRTSFNRLHVEILVGSCLLILASIKLCVVTNACFTVSPFPDAHSWAPGKYVSVTVSSDDFESFLAARLAIKGVFMSWQTSMSCSGVTFSGFNEDGPFPPPAAAFVEVHYSHINPDPLGVQGRGSTMFSAPDAAGRPSGAIIDIDTRVTDLTALKNYSPRNRAYIRTRSLFGNM